MKKIANIIICHQDNLFLQKLLSHWLAYASEENIWLAYGGKEKDFLKIQWENKFFIKDPYLKPENSLRPWDTYHSYQEVFSQASLILPDIYDYIHLTEYDDIPIQKDINEQQIEYLQKEKANIICYNLQRVDQTNYPVYLAQCKNEKFSSYLQSISVRKAKNLIFKTLGYGLFFEKKAFFRLATLKKTPLCFLEIAIPTFAHHLGFRIRSKKRDSYSHYFSSHKGKFQEQFNLESWSQHPVKKL